MEMNNDVIGVVGTHSQILSLLCVKKKKMLFVVKYDS